MGRTGRSVVRHSLKDLRRVLKEKEDSLSWLTVWEFPVCVQVSPWLWASGEHTEWQWWGACSTVNSLLTGQETKEEKKRVMESLQRHVPRT